MTVTLEYHLVFKYFISQKPTRTGRYKDFYNHPEYRDTPILGDAWWRTNEAAKEQRLLFLEAVINNL